MAGKTKINGISYTIKGGKTKVNGVGYSVSKGITKVDGVAKTISFSRLPSGYTEVEYITGVNGAYINVQIKPSYSVGARFAFSSKFVSNTFAPFPYCSISGNQSASYGARCHRFDSKSFTCEMGTSGFAIGTNLSVDTIYEVQFNYPSHKCYFDGVLKGTLSSGYNNSSTTMYLFAYSLSNTPKTDYYGTSSLYYYEVYNNDTLVNNLIPCINPNNQVGMYDLVSNTFFGNSGGGSFTAGNPV